MVGLQTIIQRRISFVQPLWVVWYNYIVAHDKRMLMLAAKIAVKGGRSNRSFFLGAVGQRNDGVIMEARNISATDYAPNHHAEARLVRKMTPDSTVWVARVSKRDGSWALARPCEGCQIRMRFVGVRKVIYTIGPDEWGVMVL